MKEKWKPLEKDNVPTKEELLEFYQEWWDSPTADEVKNKERLTLEDMVAFQIFGKKVTDMDKTLCCGAVEIIKRHYQENPEEIITGWEVFQKATKKRIYIDIDRILKSFDKHFPSVGGGLVLSSVALLNFYREIRNIGSSHENLTDHDDCITHTL